MREVVEDPHGSVTRRRFVEGAAALAAGGSVLNAIARRALADPKVPGVKLGSQPRGLPARQHAWAEYLADDAYGNPQAPQYDRLLFFDVRGKPTLAHVRLLESRLRTLERLYKWNHKGLLFTLSWGPAYFKLIGVPSPVPKPGRLSTFERPVIDNYDVCLHLASDDEQRLIEIEAALLHGRHLTSDSGSISVASALVWRETRTGFTGIGIPAANQAVKGIPSGDPVPTTSPLFMGFKSGLRKNQASEDFVTIKHGPFAQGTVMHVSYMRENLGTWYGSKFTEQDRIARMYSPQTNANLVTKITEDKANTTADTKGSEVAIETYGVIGHSQATAQARRGGHPLIVRRDFNTTDAGYAGLHFVSIQSSYEDFVVTRNAMNANGAHNVNKKVKATTNNGINAFIDVRRRANYIIPSRADRSFPLLPGRDSVL